MIETNKIYCGDNLELLRNKNLFPDNSIDLIYLDPPFFSQKNYEQIWGDADEVRSFQDRWSGGITHYIGWMSERLKEIHRILKPTGSIYLHCDWHASHYLKIEMDKIFGYDKFINEVVWSYEGGGRSKENNFARKHDILLVYSKNKNHTFNMNNVLLPHTEAQISRYNIEKDGKRYANMKGKLRELGKGKIPSDTWVDIPPLSCNEKERLGYPTQKPEALLERIIKASSNENDIVLDPFCGCGTTVAVAKKLNRKFIGIDISPIACKLIATRISYPEFDIIGLPVNTTDLAKMKPHEFQQWICDKMLAKNTSPDPKKHSGSDKGIDGIVNYSIEYPQLSGSPIQVKQSDGVGINVVKNLYATMLGMKAKTGFIVALSFGSGAVEQVAKYRMEENEVLKVDIKLIRAEDLCKIKYYNYGSILA